jgi:hypothetical protein
MIVITDFVAPAATLTLTWLIEVGVTGHVETGTRDTGAQRRVAARKAQTHTGKATLVLAAAAVHVVVVVVVVAVVIVIIAVGKNETSQFQQDGPQLFATDISLDWSRIAGRAGTGGSVWVFVIGRVRKGGQGRSSSCSSGSCTSRITTADAVIVAIAVDIDTGQNVVVARKHDPRGLERSSTRTRTDSRLEERTITIHSSTSICIRSKVCAYCSSLE